MQRDLSQPRLAQVAFELGVPITFGSDAHAPEEVGLNFSDAVDLARSVGYRERCTFTQRLRKWCRSELQAQEGHPTVVLIGRSGGRSGFERGNIQRGDASFRPGDEMP